MQSGFTASEIVKQYKFLNRKEHSRACLKNAFPGVCVTLCGMQDPIGEAQWGYGDQIGAQQAAKWGVQTGGMIFQTRSRIPLKIYWRTKKAKNAKGQVDRIKKAVLCLGTFPQSHQEQNEDRYAEKSCRQLLIENYIVIFALTNRQNGLCGNDTVSGKKSIR